jgi:DEAD/DEAH box helicase domain-containing protein
VISTSALEMGIDVGGLDACVLVGYPGSVMATWQRAGRVGRSGRESLTALVALPDALDQYFLDHPSELLDRPCERLVLDPANEPVSRAHLVCAAAELPLSRSTDGPYLEAFAPLVGDLLREGQLVEGVDSADIRAARRRPHRSVYLRGTGEPSTILEASRGRTVGTVDGVRVLHECHPGAVYLHGGRQYLVGELDLPGGKVLAEAVHLDYFTTPLTEKETEVREVLRERTAGSPAARLARLLVSERVVGYEEKRLGTQEVQARHALELPASRFETVGLYWEVPRPVEEALRLAGDHFLGALHACEHAAISLFPLLALCDRNDIGGISYSFHPQVEGGVVFLYDGHPGGIGLAARVFDDLEALLGRVLELVEGCSCEAGCPSCVQSPKCGNGNRPLDKAGAARLLTLLLGREAVPPEALAAAGRPRVAAPTSPRRPSAEALLPSRPESSPPAAEASPRGEEALSPPASGVPRAGRATLTALFDLETLRSADEVGGWDKAHRMGVAVGVVCLLEEGRFEVFAESQVQELVALLRQASLVVGFNIRRFDYRVLSGYTGEDYNRTLPTLDLLEDLHRRLGFRLGLGALAEATLGAGKSADGLQSLEWVRQGRLDLVTDYCRHDVEILRDLYLHGRRERCVYYRDRGGTRLKLSVDW